MFLYILLVVLLVFLSLSRKTNIAPVFILLFLISILRDVSVGIDYESHKEAFDIGFSWKFLPILMLKYEIGWILLNILVEGVYNNFLIVIIFTSLITLSGVFYVIKKECISPIMGVSLYVLLYYYFIPFSLIRQGAAVSMVFLASYFYFNGFKRKFWWSFVLAIMFHYSSILILPFIYLAEKVRISKRIMVSSIIGSFVLGFIGFGTYFRYLMTYLPFDKYSNYDESYSGTVINILNTYLFMIPQNIFFIIIICAGNYRKKIGYLNMLYLGLLLNNLFTVIPMVSRFVIYLNIFEIILLCNLVYENQFKERFRIRMGIAVILYALVFFSYNLVTNRAGIVPYQFIF
ncbi:EpsG family protein [Echinicola sp. 20G]|uniref:EpsG family protein n=1 Tax=Echinicola sp. 20G TaxID=2781961 RepID=UPI0019100D08